MKQEYKSWETEQQHGVDHARQPWTGFDYSVLDLPEFLCSPTFRHFVEALDHMALGIAMEMLVTVLARHQVEELRAFEMSMRKISDRDIGKELGIDHKTAKRWYEGVTSTIRSVSPLGRGSRPDRTDTAKNGCPTKGH